MKLDKDQIAVVNSDSNNICVIAGAGSGKTSVLINRVAKILSEGVDPRTIVCITFTRMAAQEMRKRLQDLPGYNRMFIGTIHSFANQLYRKSGVSYQLLTPQKERQIMTKLINQYAKVLTLDRYDKWCKAQYLVDTGKAKKETLNSVLTYAEECELDILTGLACTDDSEYPETLRSIAAKDNIITFDELLEKCQQVLSSQNRSIDYLFVDEFQDVGKFEYRFLVGLNAKHVFVVGDDYQCQPAGTQVMLSNGELKSIEDMKIGDSVVSYHNGKYIRYTDQFKDKYTTKVETISTHTVHTLYDIECGSLRTSYTGNHKCYTAIHLEGNENASIVYILKNDQGWYRIGVCNVFYLKSYKFYFPVVMQKEKAVAGWILSIHRTRRQALNQMHHCMKDFGIEKLSWIPQKYNSQSANKIKRLYEAHGDCTLRIAECLKSFGRDIRYPFRVGNDSRHFTHRWMFEVEACNLIAGIMDLYIPDKIKHIRKQIGKIRIRKGDFTVYGLHISKYHNHIADGILTHNSIYGFKGADFEYFKAISIDPKFHTYQLTNNYRCNSKIVKYSNQVIATIDDVIPKKCVSKSANIPGTIIKDSGGIHAVEKYIKYIDSRDYGDWFILVRSNNDLVDITRMLWRNKIPYITFKQSAITYEEMQQALNSNTIKVLTIHASKGLESNNVLMYGNFPDAANISKTFIASHSTEHIRIMYVGITRARNNLVIINKGDNS